MFNQKPRNQVEASLSAAMQRPYGETEMNLEYSGALAGRKRDRHTFVLEVGRIQPDIDQVRRIDKEAHHPDVIELAESIRQHGLINYPEVRYLKDEDIYQLVSGERRYTACVKVLGWLEMPVKLVDVSPDQVLWLQIAENIHRQDLNPLDLAAKLIAQHEAGLTVEEMAGKLRKSVTFVRKALNVGRRLTEDAQQVLEGSNNLEIAYAVSGLPDDQQVAVASEIVSHGLTQAEAVRLATQSKPSAGSTAANGNRRRKPKKPFSVVIKAGNARVTVSFRKSEVSEDEVRLALEKALNACQSRRAA